MPDDDITVRAADAGDCGAIHRLLNSLAVSVGDAGKVVGSVDDLRTFGFGDTPLFHALVAERQNQAIGLCLFFYTFSTWLGRPGIYVQDLYVHSSARGSGLGRRLLAKTAAIGRVQGANHLRLAVYRENASAQQFYRAIGMKFRQDECIYQADGDLFSELADAGKNS